MTEELKPFLTTQDISKLLRMTTRTIQDMCRKRKIPHMKIGGTFLFDQQKIVNWLQSKEQKVLSKESIKFQVVKKII